MYNAYKDPRDAVAPIAAVLEAARFLALDPAVKDLANELIDWAHETARRAAEDSRKYKEANNA